MMAADGDRENNVAATGALWAALSIVGGNRVISAQLVTDDQGYFTNELDVRFAILKSPYRVTVRRVDEP